MVCCVSRTQATTPRWTIRWNALRWSACLAATSGQSSPTGTVWTRCAAGPASSGAPVRPEAGKLAESLDGSCRRESVGRCEMVPEGRQVRGSGSHPQITAARSHVRRRYGNRSLARTSLPSSEKPGIRVPPYRFFGLAKDYRPQAGFPCLPPQSDSHPRPLEPRPRRSRASLEEQRSYLGTAAQKKGRLPTAHGPRTRGESLIPLKQDVRGRYPRIRNANFTSARDPLRPTYRTPSETPSSRLPTNQLRAAQPARTPLPILCSSNYFYACVRRSVLAGHRNRGAVGPSDIGGCGLS